MNLKTGGILLGTLALLLSPALVLAAPFNADNNPNIVANYDSGIHTIVGEEGDIHVGMDVVMKRGNSGKFQQWFVGTSSEEGFHGEHSVWNLDPNPSGGDWILVENAYPGWGDYLEPGADYQVKTNEFLNGNN